MDVLILADDLSGAADCATAAGPGALVELDWSHLPDGRVVAVDLDSRRLAPDEARARAGNVLGQIAGRQPPLIYQKMDTLLRGNWPFELAGIRAALGAGRSRPPMAVVAPAWPERARVVFGGEVELDRKPLSSSDLTDDNGRPMTGSIRQGLADAGVSFAWIPAGPAATIVQRLRQALAADIAAVICDAVTRTDLDAIATASLMERESLFCVGSGGLMSSLASPVNPAGVDRVDEPHEWGPILCVVGSASATSRQQVDALVRSGIEVATVTAAEIDIPHPPFMAQVKQALAAGRGIAIAVAGATGEGALRAKIVVMLARHLAPELAQCGGLVLTGGETARAVFGAAGVRGIRMMREIEPGVPLGTTIGRLKLAVVTKAGAFGGPDALVNAMAAIENLMPKGKKPMPSGIVHP